MKCALLFFYGLLVVAQGILNGEDAKEGEIPYQVVLRSPGHTFCSGVIINEYWILTTAMCVNRRELHLMEVRAGIDISNPYSTHAVERYIMHKNYEPSENYKNDIALIKLETPLEYSSRIQPAILPESHSGVKTNSTAVISGWGDTDGGYEPDRLQKATIYIRDREVCRAALKLFLFELQPHQVCANDPIRQRGDCTGDGGGPLTVNGIVVGILSYSPDFICASPRVPSVFTQVSEYIDWIQQQIDEEGN